MLWFCGFTPNKKIDINVNNNIEITKLYEKFYKVDLSNISISNLAYDLRKFSGVCIHLVAARNNIDRMI